MFLHARVETFRLAQLLRTGRKVTHGCLGAQHRDAAMANRCACRLLAVALIGVGGLDETDPSDVRFAAARADVHSRTLSVGNRRIGNGGCGGCLGANAAVQSAREVAFDICRYRVTTHTRLRLSTSMDPFMRKLHDRPINGKYVLIEKLGKGGFGVVYRGTHSACAS